MGHTQNLFRLFYVLVKQILRFSNKLMQRSPFGIQYWNPNLQPSEHESHPITTRPGL